MRSTGPRAVAGRALPVIAAPATTLHVTRTSHYLSRIDHTSNDSARVDELLRAVHALRQVPPGAEFHCPIDFGTEYQLTFVLAGGPPTSMNMNGSGCRFLRVEPSGPTYFQTDGFRALFREVTGIRPLEFTPGG